MEKDTGGGVGGVRDGHAARHSEARLDHPRPAIGWFPTKPANPQRGGPETPIGPNSALWERGNGRSGAYTTGDQRGGKPKR
jgi:hypothetical protein